MMKRRHILICLGAGAMGASASGTWAADKPKAGGDSYTPVRTLTANTFSADGRRGVFSVECGLDAPDPAVRVRVVGLMPRLRDAFAGRLQVFASALRPGQVPDLDLLARLMQADTDRVIGRPGARFLLGACILN